MRRLMLVFAATFTLLVPSPTLAGTALDRPKIIVGGDQDNPPYEFIEDGKPTGFNIEIMRAVAQVAGFDVEFRLAAWDTVRHELEKGKIEALSGMNYTPERSRLVDFTVPITMASPGLFVRKGSPVRSFPHISGNEIIVQNGDVMHDYLGEKSLASRIITVENPGETLRLLASGKHDGALMPSRLQGEYFINKYGLEDLLVINTGLPQFNYCFAVKKGNRDLLARLDEGLNILKVTGTYRKIHDKWFGVYEQKDLWETIKHYVLALSLVAVLCLGFLIWSATLKKQVGLRTAELRRREEELRFTQYAIDRTVSQAFWMTDNGRLFYVNDAACRALGFTRDELIGMTIPDIDPTYPLERFAEHWRDLREHGSLTFETCHQTRDGRIYPVEIRANYVVFDGKEYNCAFATDISERKRAEEELRQAHDELEKRVEERTAELARTTEALIAAEREKSLFLNITDALVLYYDTEMNILWANRAAGDSVNMTQEELQKKHCWEVWHQRQEPCMGCPVVLARDTGQPREAEVRTPDGRVWFIRAYPVKDETGRLIGMVEFTQDFTERKLMEEALQEANLVVENSPVVLFRWKATDDWPVELVSANVIQFGYTPEEFLSGTIDYSSIIHPEDLERVTREVRDYCAGGAGQFLLEYRITTKWGSTRWVNEHTNVERNAAGCVNNFQGIVIDVTDHKRMEVAISESRAKYQAIVDNFDGIIYICSQDYRIEFMNRKLIERTGYDGTGEFCYQVMNGLDAVCPWCVNDRVFAGETLHWEMFSPKDEHWYHVVNVPIPRADGSMSKQSMMLDITDRKMFEEQLQHQKQQLEELNGTLEKRVEDEVTKNREKDVIMIQQNRQAALGEMLDHITHQWKQPLNGISILMQYLDELCSSDELGEEQVRETVESSLSLLEHMSQTIDVFRDFYRLEKEKKVFRIMDSLERALIFFEPALKFHSIEVDLEGDPGLLAMGYPKEYTQVLLNVLANARDALKERAVENKLVKIRAFADGPKAVITISDNAGGIPEAIIGKVFDLYFSTRGSRCGTGVGLYMSKNIIEKNMGGTLSAENIEGGALFRIELTTHL